ncbi:MAG: SDR family oxidoreductase [Gemmatimonadetes bacterium]|nr:SDR family oxidoreductase [Gemmatimonadota bacterium]
MKRWEYKGRWALVTGASTGIGEAFARSLAARGMHLVLTARREDRLRALTDELTVAHGIRTHVIPLDLAEPGAPEEIWRQAADGREIHLLVNNAGFGFQGAFHELPRDREVSVVQVNITAVLELAHLALQGMRARGEGGILNVASVAAFQPLPTLATYAASKAFVLYFSEALWEENRRAGVRVVALCPGRTPTGFQERAGTGIVDRSTPGFKLPAEVAEAGLRALEKGRSYVIPGAVNYVNSFSGVLLPRQLLMRMLGKLIRRFV